MRETINPVDIKAGDRFRYLDIPFTAAGDAEREPSGVSRSYAVWVPVEGGGHVKLIDGFEVQAVYTEAEGAAFKAGDLIQARDGRGHVYQICYLFYDRGVLHYRTDSGSVTYGKLGVLHMEVERADRSYKKVS